MNRLPLLALLTSAAVAAFVLIPWGQDAVAQDAPESSPASNQKWEYRVIRIDDRRPDEAGRRASSGGAEAELNKLGEQGWELVTIRIDATTARSRPIFYFKRPKN